MRRLPAARRAARLAVLLLAGVVVACPGPAPRPEAPAPSDRAGGPLVRVALVVPRGDARLSATGRWELLAADGERRVRAGAGEEWTVERSGTRLRAVRGGTRTPLGPGPLIARPTSDGTLVRWNGRRYRGELLVHATDTGLVVVNRLPLEQYLRGVVPLEIGDRPASERAAMEAQAVAARSFTFIRLRSARTQHWDLVSTVADQVYGGVEAERAGTDAAVARTAGLVLRHGGRVVNAPYHSTCGGSTAEVQDVWYRSGGEPYLRRVSDRIPGTTRYYCDPSPRFTWTRRFDREGLDAALRAYLRRYATVSGEVGVVRALEVTARTPGGRVATLDVVTDRGRHTLRGNDVRYVLRAPGSEILNSTYFSVEAATGADDSVAELTLRGGGYGHGIGMCQWGAIGRARAGQGVREILGAYYPGTTVAPAR